MNTDNKYTKPKQLDKICLECGERVKIELLGPGDYRNTIGDYTCICYKCENCNNIFNVIRK